MVEARPLILSFRSAGLKDLDPCNVDEVHTMWHAFSKAKNCIEGGDRLEYLSWRIYSREVMRRNAITRPENIEIKMGTEHRELEYESDTTNGEDECYLDIQCANNDSAMNGTMQINVEFQDNDASRYESYSQTKFPSQSLKRAPKIHRPISSLEIQQLFDDVQKNSPDHKSAKTGFSSISSYKSLNRHIDSSFSKPLQHTSKDTSPVVKLEYCDGSLSALTSQQHSTLIRIHENSLSSMSEAGADSSSVVVRGFSPSISIKMMNSSPESTPREASAPTAKDKIDSPLSASSNMFFFEADSESDSSSVRSVRSVSSVVTGDNSSHNVQSISTDNSEWDDTDDENAEDEDNEARRRDMFVEKEVPSKPLLKRSLLSSLFISQAKDLSKSPEPSHSNAEEYLGGTDDSSNQSLNKHDEFHVVNQNGTSQVVAVPPDILPDVQPLPETLYMDPDGSQKKCASEDQEAHSHIDVEGLICRPILSNSRSVSANDGTLSLKDVTAEQFHKEFSKLDSNTHILSRPEMCRASTDSKLRRRTTSIDDLIHKHWAHHHEDIYDPMNYHSRGW